jgi:hypothetical protein
MNGLLKWFRENVKTEKESTVKPGLAKQVQFLVTYYSLQINTVWIGTTTINKLVKGNRILMKIFLT